MLWGTLLPWVQDRSEFFNRKFESPEGKGGSRVPPSDNQWDTDYVSLSLIRLSSIPGD